MKEKQKIYDCFTFFNELDLLELRLEELYDKVDYFIIVEANRTFSGKEKKLHFQENIDRFKKWDKKIKYVQVKDMPKIKSLDKFLIWLEKVLPRKPQLFLRKFLARIVGGVARYKMIEYQRRCILRGLKECNEEDIILGVDIDEIPNPDKFDEMKDALKKYKFVEFEEQQFRYFINGKIEGPESKSAATRACKYKTLKKDLKGKIDFLRTTPCLWRKFNKEKYGPQNYYKIKEGGWHFSYLGGVDKVIEKFSTRSHPEVDKEELKNPENVRKMIKGGKIEFSNSKIKYVKIGKSFPKKILKNKEKYSKYIK